MKFLIIPKEDEKNFKMTLKSGKSFYLQAATLIDPTIGRIEIHNVPSAHVNLVANQVELV